MQNNQEAMPSEEAKENIDNKAIPHTQEELYNSEETSKLRIGAKCELRDVYIDHIKKSETNKRVLVSVQGIIDVTLEKPAYERLVQEAKDAQITLMEFIEGRIMYRIQNIKLLI